MIRSAEHEQCTKLYISAIKELHIITNETLERKKETIQENYLSLANIVNETQQAEIKPQSS